MTSPAGAAVRTLRGGRYSIAEAEVKVPRAPGLYAVYGGPETWHDLGLGNPPDGRPLYVGKSESSLLGRDIGQHFGDGRTGSSTVRRSFAALLRGKLDLHAIPRNPARPERFANYGLSPDNDRQLTAWMKTRLELAVWPSPADAILRVVELEVLSELLPPLNLSGVTTQWSSMVSSARALMAAEARAWARKRGFGI